MLCPQEEKATDVSWTEQNHAAILDLEPEDRFKFWQKHHRAISHVSYLSKPWLLRFFKTNDVRLSI